jgi:hypothetical protein
MCSDVATSGKNTNLGGYLFGLKKIVENLLMGLYIIFCLSVLFGVHAQL